MLQAPKGQVVIEGQLRKKSNRGPLWSKRYFKLRDIELLYYHRDPATSDKETPVSLLLQPGCTVSEIKQHYSRTKQRSLYCFKLQWPGVAKHGDPDDDDDLGGGRGGGGATLAPPPPGGATRSTTGASAFSEDFNISNRGRETSMDLFPPIMEERQRQGQSVGPEEFHPELPGPADNSRAPVLPFKGTEVVLRRRPGGGGGVPWGGLEAGGGAAAGYGASPAALITAMVEENPTLRQLLKVKTSAALVQQSAARAEGQEAEKKKKKLTKKSAAGLAALAVSGVVVGAATAGVGLAAGLVVVGVSAAAGGGLGAAATFGATGGGGGGGGGGGAAAGSARKGGRAHPPLVLGGESEEEARRWKAALEGQIRLATDMGGAAAAAAEAPEPPLPRGPGGAAGGPQPQTVLVGLELWKNVRYWVAARGAGGAPGVRVYDPDPAAAAALALPARLAEVAIPSSPFETFMCLMSAPNTSLLGVVESMRALRTVDDHCDVIHLCLRPQRLAGTWVAARDFCLARFWKLDDDGNYTVFWDSVDDRGGCPPVAGYVRAELHTVFIVSPKKGLTREAESTECLVTQILQLDPRGWVWRRGGYTAAYAALLLDNLADIRDLIQRERFMEARPDGASALGASTSTAALTGSRRNLGAAAAAAAAGAGGQAEAKEDPLGGMTSEPEPMDQTMWAEPDGTTFTVRGASYLQDKIKVASPPSLFYLVAVDFFEVPKPRFHILSHPQNRVQLAAAKGATPFIFAVQIMLPGPPNYAFVAYFTPEDPDIFKQDTPFTRLAKPFFFGEDTEEMNHFRDHRFKLIPQMIEANYVVKKATGNTPAIIGTKLKQSYFRGRNYFELDLDVASSSIAARITRLAVSYSKTVTVDIGFVLQGNREEELPEQMLCAVRSAKLDITHATPLS